MAFTQATVTGGTIGKEIKQIKLSTATGGATEDITFSADSIHSPVLTLEALTTPNAMAEVGQQIGQKLMLDFVVIGLAAASDKTAISELKDQANNIAFVEVTYRNDDVQTFDSGTTGTSIAFASATQSNDGDGILEYRVHLERIIENATFALT